MIKLPKPLHGAPCNGCGRCCKDQLCPVCQRIFGKPWLRQCPALVATNSLAPYGCGLALNPGHYTAAAPSEHQDLANAAALLIGAGFGCDALDAASERPNLKWRREVKSKLLRRAAEIRAAKLLWGIGE